MLNFTFLLWGLSGLPLLIYPFVLMANVMSLAGGQIAKTPQNRVESFSKKFMISSTFYPFVYFSSLIVYIQFGSSNTEWQNFLLIGAPFLYLGILFFFFLVWMGS